MSARRQPSTTSLSRYAKEDATDFSDHSLDFCNAFWGQSDAGVDVLFARMRGAARTMDELRNFWKERASIEEQYAKRLASLAKFTLGRDEIGETRNSLDTLRSETEKQAISHLQISQQMKTDLEGQTAHFLSKQQAHKKQFQAAIEKEFKSKQTQESYVTKAREKYEADCVKINAFTAQASLSQGRELERLQQRLERAQQTVQANERDYASFARALQETTRRWEADWKVFCDSCQDMEEERIDLMKENMWAYANAVSTVCVADDEACEKLRLSLEQLEPDKDMEAFVRDYGTGNAIPDPPVYVNYSRADAAPPSSQRITTRPANFTRHTNRERPAMSTAPVAPDEEPATNAAGIGAGGGHGAAEAPPSRSQAQSRASIRIADGAATNGAIMNGTSAPVSNRLSMMAPRQADPQADPIDPTHKTMLKVGPNAYEVDLSRDPQARPTSSGGAPAEVGQEDDPLKRQMEQLRAGTIRRSGQQQQPPQHSSHQSQDSRSQPPSRGNTQSSLSPPPGASTNGNSNRRRSQDYRKSAELVVGSYPEIPRSRPTSPNPPTAHFMNPPPQNSDDALVQNTIANYQQSLPGEGKSISRTHSPANSFSGPPGQAGIGARGRSTSPQPFVPLSRSASPAVSSTASSMPQFNRNSYGNPPPSSGGHSVTSSITGPAVNSTPQRSGSSSMSVPQVPAQRPVSPNSIGIALDPNGQVKHDEMAVQYAPRQQQLQKPPPIQQQLPPPAQQPVNQYRQIPPQQIHPQQPPPQQHQQPQRQRSYRTAPNNFPPQPIPPQSQVPYGAPAPGAVQGYAPYSQQQAPGGYQPQPAQYQPPVQNQVYHQPPPQSLDYPHQNGLQRAPSGNNGYYPPQPAQQGQIGQQLQQPYPQTQGYRSASPLRGTSPQPPAAQAPPPTGQFTDAGRAVLFYVQAMYDYQASIEEEFDFQAGDIIAVTDTPEDGWWSGELLDEARRQSGRHVFPSNFVCLF